eukprot:TRINITY_DN814_c0_g2_i1.p3 TRINITY_DN814_c0_g2~~TRINITY_DN814_c0_g2_i1.p3  ORF type:complete len:177 (+),score=3.31 TRINITY_DN814_c0_g2_i1:24-533(+)
MSRKLFCSFTISFLTQFLKNFCCEKGLLEVFQNILILIISLTVPVQLIEDRDKINIILQIQIVQKKKGQQLIKPKQQLFIQFSWQVIYQFIYLYFKVGQMNFSPQTFQGFGFCLFFLVFSFFFCILLRCAKYFIDSRERERERRIYFEDQLKLQNYKLKKGKKLESKEQ